MIGAEKQGRLTNLPVGRVRPPANPLRTGVEDVADLAQSIRRFGMLHPILVRPSGRAYEIVSGYRRFLACLQLRLGEIPAFVRELTDREALEIRLAENARRASLTAGERSRILEHLAQLYPALPQTELEQWIGSAEPEGIPEPAREESVISPPDHQDTTILPPVDTPPVSTPPSILLRPPSDRHDTTIINLPTQTEPAPEPPKSTILRPPTERHDATILSLRGSADPGTVPTESTIPPPRVDWNDATILSLSPPPAPPPKSAVLPPPGKRQETTMIGLVPVGPAPEPSAPPEKPVTERIRYPRRAVARVRRLLSTLAGRAHLEINLLALCTGEILENLETQPAVEFLDLSYPESPKRYLPRHSLNVAKIAVYVGRTLGCPREDLSTICIAALLHDVALFRVPTWILRKGGALSSEEAALVHLHPEEGALLLSKFPALREEVVRLVREHHERPNRGGYPHALGRADLHPYAGLLQIADTYEALVSPRTYKLAHLPHDAIRILVEGTKQGEHDAGTVGAFVQALSNYPVGSYVKLVTGEVARVEAANPGFPEKPGIRIIADRENTILKDQPILDLSLAAPLSFTPIPRP